MNRNDILVELHSKCMRNRDWLAGSKICGCFYCLKEFKFQQISEWVDEGSKTALCPYCGIDSVLGFESASADATLLRQMHDHWFSRPIRLTADEWQDAIKNNAWPPSVISRAKGKQE